MLRSCVGVQDKKYDHARYRDVKPDRQRPSSDAAMKTELSAKGIPEGGEDERQREHRQADMRDQDEEVNRPYPTLSREPGIAVEVVVGDVAEQKQGREDRGRHHEAHVNHSVSSTYVDVAENQADCAQRVEDRV